MRSLIAVICWGILHVYQQYAYTYTTNTTQIFLDLSTKDEHEPIIATISTSKGLYKSNDKSKNTHDTNKITHITHILPHTDLNDVKDVSQLNNDLNQCFGPFISIDDSSQPIKLYWKDEDQVESENILTNPRKCTIRMNSTYQISFEIVRKQGEYQNFIVRSLNSFGFGQIYVIKATSRKSDCNHLLNIYNTLFYLNKDEYKVKTTEIGNPHYYPFIKFSFNYDNFIHKYFAIDGENKTNYTFQNIDQYCTCMFFMKLLPNNGQIGDFIRHQLYYYGNKLRSRHDINAGPLQLPDVNVWSFMNNCLNDVLHTAQILFDNGNYTIYNDLTSPNILVGNENNIIHYPDDGFHHIYNADVNYNISYSYNESCYLIDFELLVPMNSIDDLTRQDAHNFRTMGISKEIPLSRQIQNENDRRKFVDKWKNKGLSDEAILNKMRRYAFSVLTYQINILILDTFLRTHPDNYCHDLMMTSLLPLDPTYVNSGHGIDDGISYNTADIDEKLDFIDKKCQEITNIRVKLQGIHDYHRRYKLLRWNYSKKDDYLLMIWNNIYCCRKMLMQSFIQLLKVYKNYDDGVLSVVNRYEKVVGMYQIQFDKYIFIHDKNHTTNCYHVEHCLNLTQWIQQLNQSILVS